MQKLPLPKIGRPATNALNGYGIFYLQNLQKISEQELANMHGVGPKAIKLLKLALKDANLKFK